MRARLVPGSNGWRWLAEGWKLFRASPLMWLVLVSAYWMLMSVVSILPFVGVVAAVSLVPGFSVAFMAASRESERGGQITLALLFTGFRERARPQLALGAAYFAMMVLMLGASTLADDGALARWMLTGARPPNEVLQSDGFVAALGVTASLYMPIMMLMWFAPTLVAWHAMPVAKALFFSLFACLMNWRAFAVYGIAAALVLIVLPIVLLFVLMLASGGTMRPAAMGLLFPLVFSLMPVMFASFYASYRDIFAPQAGDEEPAPSPDADPAPPAPPL
jgi:hypothetical protein